MIYMREFKDFLEFYKCGYNLAQEVKAKTECMSASKRVKYARQFIDKSFLNSYIKIGCLSKVAIDELNSKTKILKFSIDNLIKNCITHSDVSYEDYLKIPLISLNPSKILTSKNGYDIMLFKEDKKYYQLIVKTTKNKQENYIKSFHLLKENRYNKY